MFQFTKFKSCNSNVCSFCQVFLEFQCLSNMSKYLNFQQNDVLINILTNNIPASWQPSTQANCTHGMHRTSQIWASGDWHKVSVPVEPDVKSINLWLPHVAVYVSNELLSAHYCWWHFKEYLVIKCKINITFVLNANKHCSYAVRTCGAEIK